MFWDCLRCGYGYHYHGPWREGHQCPLCSTLSDEAAGYVRDLHKWAVVGRTSMRECTDIECHKMYPHKPH